MCVLPILKTRTGRDTPLDNKLPVGGSVEPRPEQVALEACALSSSLHRKSACVKKLVALRRSKGGAGTTPAPAARGAACKRR
eukprot:1775833-Pleurochrysis_carterae.AAC.1